jgi:hypothetical protein
MEKELPFMERQPPLWKMQSRVAEWLTHHILPSFTETYVYHKE